MLYQNNCRLLILPSAQTCLICPENVTGEMKAFTSQCQLRKGHDSISNYDVHRIVCSARILDTLCFCKDFFYLSSLF